MKIERTKNAGRNMVFGWGVRVYQIGLQFLIRTAMIYWLGVEYLGLNSLFTSILQVLNLAELGVGSAMVYSMYKPIAEDDEKTICALMSLYKKYYRIIGLVILVVGIVLCPFIPLLIKSDLPNDVNVYILYLLNLCTTVLSYWLFAYKNCLLTAHQRNDVSSKVSIITTTVQYAIQFLLLFVFRNYYFYLIVTLATQIVNNVIIAFVVGKMYPRYKDRGTLDKSVVKEINGRIKDLFTAKLGAVVVNSVDTIVISAFLGLKVLAIYQNYFYLITAVIGFVTVVFSACSAGIGNSIIVETKGKNFNDLKKFTFIITWIAGWCACCFLCLFQPFMELWVGKELMFAFPAVIMFCIYFYVYEVNTVMTVYKDAAGMWHEDRFRPLVTAIVNLGMNLILVNRWGIYGVLLSTVLSMLGLGIPWLLHNLFTVVFEKKQLVPYIKKLFSYTVVSIMSCFITYLLCAEIRLETGALLIVRGIICCTVPNIIYIIVYYRSPEFLECVSILKRITKGKMSFIRK